MVSKQEDGENLRFKEVPYILNGGSTVLGMLQYGIKAAHCNIGAVWDRK
jgi:hypothetical protein